MNVQRSENSRLVNMDLTLVEQVHSGAVRKILNLVSGLKRLPDAFNVDKRAWTNPEIVHDLNSIPWPLPDSQFEKVLLEDSLEHLEDIVATMEEIHRVCENSSIVRITMPYFSSNCFTDPTHLHHFSYFSFDYFTGEHDFDFYSKKRFRQRRHRSFFSPRSSTS